MALGPVKAHVAAAANAIIAQFGIKTVYGWRPVDPFPDHPSGLAVDFMITDIPNGKAVGDALAAYVVQNGVALGVKYLIWYRRTYNVVRGTWQPYTQAGQPPHTDHVHVTWNPQAGSGVVTTPVSAVGQASQTLQQLSDIASWFTDGQKVARIRIVALGVALVIFGLLRFDKVARVAGTAARQVTKVVKNGGS